MGDYKGVYHEIEVTSPCNGKLQQEEETSPVAEVIASLHSTTFDVDVQQ